jgi:RNA polymerase sigma-70 factor (ECF subfamily)
MTGFFRDIFFMARIPILPAVFEELICQVSRQKSKGDAPLALTNDETLVKRFQEGDGEAFRMIIMRYADRIVQLAYRYLGDYDEADDCAQEIFIKIHDRMDSFRYRSSFSTWLYRVAVNYCRDHLRSASHRRARSNQSWDNPGQGRRLAAREDERPDRVFEKSEEEQRVQAALEKVPSRERVCLILSDMEGRSTREISEITGLSPGTVKSTLYRARRRMRSLLEEESL